MFLPSLLYFLWSLSFPIGKKLLEFSTPMFITGSRMILGATLLLSYIFIFKKNLFKKISKTGWIALFILGFFSIFLTNSLEFWSLKHLSSSKTCFLYSLSPFLTSILSYFHFNEKMTKRKWLGIIIGVAGMLPILIIDNHNEIGVKSIFNISIPEISMFLAVFFAVYGWIILRILVKDNSLSPLIANGISMLIGGVISILFSYHIDIWNPTPIRHDMIINFSKFIILLTIISNIICYNLYGYLLKKYTATILSFFGLLSPVFASFHGYLILGESISPIIFISTGIVLLGLKLVYNEELKLGYIQKKSVNDSSHSSP